jgi:hypothetical protein
MRRQGPYPDSRQRANPHHIPEGQFHDRTDQQFWGEATWLNPLSVLNLDRSSVAR